MEKVHHGERGGGSAGLAKVDKVEKAVDLQTV